MFKLTRYYLGMLLVKPGAKLWEIGGYPSENYEDLKWYGKLGYNLMITGFDVAGLTMKDLELLLDIYDQVKGTE